jgi:hypothetical protein
MPKTAFGLSLDAWGRLVLIDSEGRRHIGVEPVRGFPMSDPGHWIALVDEKGREVAMVEDLDDLSPATRELLEQELARREFVPRIDQIVRISRDTAPCDWDVETDRGRTTFTLDSVDMVRRLADNRVLVTDARGLRYQIQDPTTLDRASRRYLEWFL